MDLEICKISKDFIKQGKTKYEVLYLFIKREYEKTPESLKFSRLNYKCHEQGLYLVSYEDWAWDFGNLFLYKYHHGDEIAIMAEPQFYFALYEEEIVKFYLTVYAKFLPSGINVKTFEQLLQKITEIY